MRRLALAALASLLLTAGLVFLPPSASAHPVHVRCSGVTGVDPQGYLGQFEPTDPNTWTSGLVYVTAPVTVCQAECRQWEPHCYPMPCFHPYGEEPECDGSHVPVPLPPLNVNRPAEARSLP